MLYPTDFLFRGLNSCINKKSLCVVSKSIDAQPCSVCHQFFCVLMCCIDLKLYQALLFFQLLSNWESSQEMLGYSYVFSLYYAVLLIHYKSYFLFQVCPFLLRVFTNVGRPYHVSEFSRGNLPPNQVSIYTW